MRRVISAEEIRPSSSRRDTISRSIASRLNGNTTPLVSVHSVALFRYPTSENVKADAGLVGFGNPRILQHAESDIAQGRAAGGALRAVPAPVSYTHLTLP